MLTNQDISTCDIWVGVPVAVSVCLHRVASPLHRLATAPLAWLHRHPRYNPSFAYLGRRSRNQVRRFPSERDTVGGMHIFAYLRPYLFQIVHVIWTARGCVDEFSFHGPLRSETGFRHYHPCCSPDTHSPCQDVYRENSGEVLPKLCLG